MTRIGPRKRVDAMFWQGRLNAASDYRAAAQEALLLAEPRQNCSPIASQVILAAIAYADAITARKAQIVNQQDHTAVARHLREVLRNQLPDAQERRLRRLLGHKDEVQYGVRAVTPEEARQMLEELDKLALWAEDLLR
jgi:hypothetical protein